MSKVSFWIVCSAGLLLVFCSAGAVQAAVFASDLTAPTGIMSASWPITLMYTLNETGANQVCDLIIRGPSPATTIVRTLDITEADPAQVPDATMGYNSVEWDGLNDLGVAVSTGEYTWEVYAANDGVGSFQTTSWYHLVDTSAPNNPVGIAVVTDPSSPRFGHLYVAHEKEDAGAGDTLWEYDASVGGNVGDGVAGTALNSFGAEGGGLDWDENGTVPRLPRMDEDGHVYVANWYDGASPPNNLREIWRFDPDGANPTIVLQYSTNSELDDTQRGLRVVGTGTSKTIYVIDTGALGGEPFVKWWVDSDGDGLFSDEVLSASFELNSATDPDGTHMDIALDDEGNIYVASEEGATGGDSSIAKYTSAGVNVWRNNTFTYVRGIDIYPGANPLSAADDVLIIDSISGSSSGCTFIDISDGSTIDGAQTWSAYGTSDPVGNEYHTSQAGRYIKRSTRVGANSYTKSALTAVNIIEQSPLAVREWSRY